MDPIVSLTRIKAVPERIDAVALDIQSGALAYAAIDAWDAAVASIRTDAGC